MREIQDLTLQVERGLGAIKARFEERREAFAETFTEFRGNTKRAYAARATLVPVTRQNRISRDMERAVSEVRNMLEKVHAAPFNEITTLYPAGTVIPISDLDDGQIVVDYDDPDADPLMMRLEMSWNSEDLGTVTRSYFTVRTE